ncbi:MAG: MFS transporter [Terriglobales bacterium]|jgi:putative MFS transporter
MATNQALSADEMNILRRLERLPMSWVQGRLLLMGGLGYVFDASSNAVVAFILPSVTAIFGLTNAQTGLLGSSVLIGYMLGAFLGGTLGDLIGRKSVMMHALAIYCVASLIAAFSPSWHFLFWSRIVSGVGTGAEAAIIAPYLSEFIQSKYRGRYVGSLSGFFAFGFVFAALLGYVIVPASREGWRIVQIITAVPIVMLLWWWRVLPESPRWLIQRGRSSEAERVVASWEEEVARRTGGALPSPDTIVMQPFAIRRGGSFFQNLGALWSPGLARSTVTLWALWISITFSYYGFFTWIPSLLVKQGLTITKSFGYSIIIYVAQIPGYYSASFLSEKLDRKWTIILYMIGGGVFAFLLANTRHEGMITLFGFFLSFFMNGTYAGIYAYTPEVYPTAIRATGMGVASSFGRIGGILAPIVIGSTFAQIGFRGVFTITTAVLLLGALVVGWMGISTTGKTLEQISAEEIGQHATV